MPAAPGEMRQKDWDMLILSLLFSIVLIAASGLPAMAFRRRSNRGQILTTILLVAGCAIGIGTLAVYALRGRPACHIALPWPTPLGRPAFTLDALGALFLLPVFGISALGSMYGIGYWPQSRGGKVHLYGLYVFLILLIPLACAVFTG